MISVPSAKKQDVGPISQYVAVALTYKVFKVLDARRADNGCSDTRQRPRQGDLGHAYAALFGDLFNPIGVLMRPESFSFAGKNGPVDNLLGTCSLKILGSVAVRTSSQITKALRSSKSTHRSVLPRVVAASVLSGRVRRPRASGDHGMMPTPKWFSVGNISRSSSRYTSEW